MGDNVILGDCLEVLRQYPDNYFSSIITDPPAGISFMGKDWDKNKGGRDNWCRWMSTIALECKRVLKPGGHALVWAIPRTSHWTAMAWEDAGWEVRDRIAHVFGSGFPKSMDVSKAIDKMYGAEREIISSYKATGTARNSKHIGAKTHSAIGDYKIDVEQIYQTVPSTNEAKQWEGWGTALKPAVEDWWLFRKPLSEKTVAKNVLKWGTGAINIDDCRVETDEDAKPRNNKATDEYFKGKTATTLTPFKNGGRFPANLVHDGSEEVLDIFPNTKSGWRNSDKGNTKDGATYNNRPDNSTGNHYEDSGSASRFFYCAKPSPKERGKYNKHPTVKGLKLMQYLITMITPPGGIILDPFAGSGTTGLAAINLGFEYVLIEQEPEYYQIIIKRITEHVSPNNS